MSQPNTVPSVSVALCTYNGAKFIAEQLYSILNQTIAVNEIIICDDCSTDKTVEICKEILSNYDIKYNILVNDTNLKPTKNFQKCIGQCTGNIIFLSDQDDIWHSDKVEKFLDIFIDNPEVLLVFSDAQVIDENGKLVYSSLHKNNHFLNNTGKFDIRECLLRKQMNPNGCFMCIRKELYDRAPAFYDCQYLYHDTFLIYLAALEGKCCYIKKQLMDFRIHSNNLTSSQKADIQWRALINKGDLFDRRFNLSVLKKERMSIIEYVLNITNSSNATAQEYKKALYIYKSLQSIKKSNRFSGCIILLTALVNGSYCYSINDRTITITKRGLLKRFISDILFLLKKQY